MSEVPRLRPRPYKGLAAFEDSAVDALFFFGRDRDSQMIAANLMASRLTVLFGPTGVGKTSVLEQALRTGSGRRRVSTSGFTPRGSAIPSEALANLTPRTGREHLPDARSIRGVLPLPRG